MLGGVTCDQKVDTLTPHPKKQTAGLPNLADILISQVTCMNETFNLLYPTFYTFLLHAPNGHLGNDKATKTFNAASCFFFLSDGT